MFARWGRLMYRRRALVLGIGVAGMALAGLFGTGVFATLQSAGGFTPPASQSAVATELAQRAFGRDVPDVVVLYSSRSMTVADPAYRVAVTSALSRLPRRYVASAASYFSTGQSRFVSPDGRQTYAVIGLTGATDTARVASWDAISGRLGARGLTEQAGGQIPFEQAANSAVKSDITRAEARSLPVVLILLTLIFGSLAAASLPLLSGGIGILGSFTVLRLLTLATPVSTYAVNITTILGLGLAIDYGLFIVSRFREELTRQRSVEQAVAATMATAGRTVAVSGVTVAAALASLTLFPETFLRSMGYGGVATVAVDMLAALTVMPALLALLGTRVNALRVRRIRQATPGEQQGGGWYRLTEDAASGETAQMYDVIRGYFGIGFVPEVFQLLGTCPRYLRALWETYLSVFDAGVLPRDVKELIAAFVANEAGCQYCAGAHSLLAQMAGASPQIVAASRARSVADMPVDDKLRALMRFVSQIDHAAYRVTDDDIVRLRDCGWTDAELVEAIWTACTFNAVVRLVDTFGLSAVGQFPSGAPGASA